MVANPALLPIDFSGAWRVFEQQARTLIVCVGVHFARIQPPQRPFTAEITECRDGARQGVFAGSEPSPDQKVFTPLKKRRLRSLVEIRLKKS